MAADKQAGVWACTIITFIPATLTFILRFYARSLKQIPLWWDDYLAILAFTAAVAYNVAAYFHIYYGLGVAVEDLKFSIEDTTYYHLLLIVIEEHTYTTAIASAQASLIALYWTLFKASSWARMSMYALMACVAAWTTGRLVVAIFQCFPPRYFWDKTIEGECHVDTGVFFLSTVSTHLVIDIALMVLPASQISQLLLPLHQKVTIGIIFMFGVVICIASMMMIIAATQYDATQVEFMLNSTQTLNWSTAEIHLSIMACCLPILRPVMTKVGGWWGHTFSSRARGGGLSDGTSGATSSVKLSSLKLSSARRSAAPRHKSSRDSFHILADSSGHSDRHHHPEANPTVIYGQGEDTDTFVTSKRRSEDGAAGRDVSGKNIMVKYEVNLSFSDNERR